MNKKALLLIIVTLVAILGVTLYNNSLKQNTSATYTPTPDVKISQSMDDKRYFEFSPGVLDKTKDSKRVLFFYANWCPTCIPADLDFVKNEAKIPTDVTVIRVNYNDSQTDSNEKELAKEYQITYQHTFIQIDSEGRSVKRWNGGKLQELISNIK